ncbi:MAG TPA: hypothetical protein VFJ43_13625, partial [Bacteroidia bacterium]|nr:hypothetical protein [Bacteroidia bacterium]
MKKLALVFAIALPGLVFAGGPSVLSAIVPQFVEGTTTSTNNNRVPFWFWGEINGLIPNATYHYFVSLDTLNSASTSNGAGLPYLVNAGSSSIRRILNPSMSSNTGYDSLVADSLGVIRGWFGVEPTANGRFLAGTTVYPKIMLNDGAGGTTVLMRLLFAGTPVTVLSFGTTSMSTTQGSALWDSLNAAPQNFICLYDNVAATGRPISIAIVENDGMSLLVPSTANFYKVKVDSLDYHWGTIIPNNLANGVRALQERDFTTADPIDTVTDSDGIWCFGTNTVNMSNGNIAKFLNSTFVLTGSAMMP